MIDKFNLISLPIDQHLQTISSMVLSSEFSLIKASTGSGKTTRIPPFLLSCTKKKILVLEPRRLAAKMQALRISSELNTKIGELVGYLFKGERSQSEKTRLLFITEGTLIRLIENDPLLGDYEIIILDEFHERHKETDLAYYYLKKIMEKRVQLKMDFHVVFMSATLDSQFLKEKIPDIREFEVIIPPFPQTIFHLPNNPLILKETLPLKVKNTLKVNLSLIKDTVTGILIFVPGKREIDDVMTSIENDSELMNLYELAPLHGELNPEDQEFALTPSLSKIKIVVSTNVAESSLTIPYINIVIDSGLEREYHGNMKTGFGKLLTKKIARASAEQRAGRSNRLRNGYVFRLYSEQDFYARANFKIPELLRSPLMESTLSLLRLHHKIEPEYFLDAPPPYHQEMSFEQLSFLGLIDSSKNLTPDGSSLDLGLDLRLSLIEKKIKSLSGRELKELLSILDPYLDFEIKKDFEIKLRTKLTKKNDLNNNSLDVDEILLDGFLDVVGIISSNKKVILQNGENFMLHPSVEERMGRLNDGSFVVILMTNAKEEITHLYPIDIGSLLTKTHALTKVIQEELTPNGKKKIITFTKLGILTLNEKISFTEKSVDDKNELIKDLLKNLSSEFLKAEDFIRYKFFSYFYGKDGHRLHDYDPQMLIDVYFLEWAENENINEQLLLKDEFLRELKTEVLGHINKEKAVAFDLLFPIKMKFSDRRDTALHYEIHGENIYEVFVESFIQDFYGLKETPVISEGKIPLTFKLLGPHKRALQVTKDLSSFWLNSYPQMYKELSREYPRHHWPLDPRVAPPILLKRQLV